MHHKTKRIMMAAGLAATMALGSMQVGCAERNLFADNDPAMQKVKYWDNESVQASRVERRDQRDSGFGFASGPADQ